MITNSDNVIIKKVATCQLDIYLNSADITYTKNTLNYIQNILGDGIFLNEVYINV